ncbi:MAG: ammonia-forming cytochrome c nitrite reductase subunit c552, partial [Ignavibacteriaceae bacterium]|nr:ammonia-forming cytochrome c nitrite reductase subunit c552 [Ignavibacteriaceae bacterium]
EHSMGGDPNKISNTNSSASCIKCHDAPPYYNTVAQGKLQLHNTPIWSNSFAQGAASQNNNLQNCIRCHDGTGYVNLTKNRTTNTTGWNLGNQTHISCATCHDPHGNSNAYSLRSAPAAADTLANGFAYNAALLGTGKLCIDCHKSRRDNVTYTETSVTNSNWGPHYSGQGDILMGKNLAEFGTPYPSSVHSFIQNSCAGCHMAKDDTPENKDKVGSHTLKMHNPDNGYDFTKPCQSCHSGITSFSDIIASSDYDSDGTIEPFVDEYNGLVSLLKYYLSPVGVDSVSWQMIGANNNLNEKKAYFNYRLIYPDGSHGIHNPKYVIAALRSSILAIGGVVSVEDNINTLPEVFNLSQNYPNPFNPSTRITFSIPEQSFVSLKVYDASGSEVAVLVNKDMSRGNHEVYFDASKLTSGIYFYTITAGKNTMTKKMLLMK